MLCRILRLGFDICLMFLLWRSIKDTDGVVTEKSIISVMTCMYLQQHLKNRQKSVILLSGLFCFAVISAICLSLNLKNTFIINRCYRTKAEKLSFLVDKKWNANDIAATVSNRLAKCKQDSYRHLFALSQFTKQTCWVLPASLKGYFKELDNNRSRSGLMRYEWARYETFKTFPIDSPVMPMRLASNGFYFNGSEDSVTCFSCGLEYRGWKEGDSVANIHALFSPNCHFVRGADQTNIGIHADEDLGATGGGNIEIDSSFRSGEVYVQKQSRQPAGNDTSTSTRPRHKYPDYESYHYRMDTFIGWPCSDIIQPEILGSAGFFYAGFSDCVRCFSCGGGLRHWEYGDGPWEEHARWFPACMFLREQRGADFIRQHREAQTDSSQELSSTAIVSGQEALNTVRANTGSEKTRLPDSLSKVKASNDESNSTTEPHSTEKSKLAKQFIQEALLPMGFSEADIQKSIQRIAIIDSTESAVTRVLDDLIENLQSHDKERQTEHSDKFSPEFDKKLIDNSTDTTDVPATSNGIVKTSAELDPKSLQEENSRLTDQLTCKICMDKESNVVFIPCGHMVSCETCAPHIRKCAICRQLIKGRVKAFMS